MPPSSCKCIPCSLCELQTLGCRPVSVSWKRIPILFPTLPTISGNLLTTFCENLEIKHAAVVTNPQTQRLHFKNDCCVWVVSYFFLTDLDDFAWQWKNREVHKGVKQKDFSLWGAACLPLCLGYRTVGLWGDAEPACSGHWEPLLRGRSVWAPLIPPESGQIPDFSLHKFIQQDPLNAREVLQGRSCLPRGFQQPQQWGVKAAPAPEAPAAAAAPGKPPWPSEEPRQFIMSSLAAECCVWGLWLSEAGFHLSLPKAI